MPSVAVTAIPSRLFSVSSGTCTLRRSNGTRAVADGPQRRWVDAGMVRRRHAGFPGTCVQLALLRTPVAHPSCPRSGGNMSTASTIHSRDPIVSMKSVSRVPSRCTPTPATTPRRHCAAPASTCSASPGWASCSCRAPGSTASPCPTRRPATSRRSSSWSARVRASTPSTPAPRCFDADLADDRPVTWPAFREASIGGGRPRRVRLPGRRRRRSASAC